MTHTMLLYTHTTRTTYQDHWLDNFGNAIVGHFFAQVLLSKFPLGTAAQPTTGADPAGPRHVLALPRPPGLRVPGEALRRQLPLQPGAQCAALAPLRPGGDITLDTSTTSMDHQMPHHHDWHHEGHKGCNYTFTSLGGLWDCLFGTRKTGRHPRAADTREDRRMAAEDARCLTLPF